MKTLNTLPDLGNYDLKKLLRNPMTIHKIQDNLMALKGDSLMAEAIRVGANKNLRGCIKMIASQYGDNPELMTQIVGKESIALIAEYEGIELDTNPNDLPTQLFTQIKND